ncbi:MAG TPA: electron transport complex subunit RsxC [Bacteroidales bacterium]|nr:electron transport complex subunit RsxC [Bacteroidales bacterium]HRX97813.1 electron transport complex subunit RsxC [Bacteroidales bacterium]
MLKTFKLGGVHPAENKISEDKKIEVLPLPKIAYIPISQHLGAPAKPLVNKGDAIKVGQQIAKGEAFISANIHSSVSGKVQKVDTVIDASGYKRTAVVVQVEGDEWEDGIDRTRDIKRDITLSQKEIIAKINEKGIVGLGGATFPSHVKLMVPDGKKADVLIINGVECEPYLTSDHRLMLEMGEEMMIGVEILKRALGVNRAVIGIENNKPDAIEHLSKIAKNFSGIEVQGLKVKYPQGAEKQLIKAIINREVPSGKLPIEVGAVVNNSGTAYAVYEAVQKNKPLIERVVTITGKSVKNPGNFMVRIGTPVSELIEAGGGLPDDTGKVISGGPMMGKALNSLEAPIVKGTSGILIMQEEEAARKQVLNCIRCSRCVSVCPMGLEPYLLEKVVMFEDFERTEKERVMDCIECGSCQFTCPANRPLLDYIRLGKNKVGQIMRARAKK